MADNYLVKVFVRDLSTGVKRPLTQIETQVENYTVCVDLPKDMPDVSRIELEFCGKVQG